MYLILYKHDYLLPSVVIQLLWLVNTGRLLSLCSDDTIYLWEVNSTSFPPQHFFFVRSRKALWSFCSSSGSTVSGSPPCPPPSSQSGFLLGRRRGTRTSSTSTTSVSPATSSTGTRPSGCTSPPTRVQSPTCWVSISANCHPSCFPCFIFHRWPAHWMSFLLSCLEI